MIYTKDKMIYFTKDKTHTTTAKYSLYSIAVPFPGIQG